SSLSPCQFGYFILDRVAGGRAFVLVEAVEFRGAALFAVFAKGASSLSPYQLGYFTLDLTFSAERAEHAREADSQEQGAGGFRRTRWRWNRGDRVCAGGTIAAT